MIFDGIYCEKCARTDCNREKCAGYLPKEVATDENERND